MRRRHFTLIGLAGVAQVVLDARQGVSGDPVDTWTGRPGTSVNATASGSARPTVGTLNGQAALVFDGVDNVAALSGALSVFRNASQGRIMVTMQSLGATPTPQVACVFLVGTSGATRLASYPVNTTQTHRTGARRLDADSQVLTRAVGNTSVPCVLESAANWSGNAHWGSVNGLASASVAFSSGGGLTSNTDSTAASIGGGATQRLHASVAAVIATNHDWSAAFAARVRHCLAFTFMIPQAA